MQKNLPGFAPKGKEFFFWALNDVGTCYFIKGEAYFKMGEFDKARKTYQVLLKKYTFAQCWDTRGWFWKPKDTAKERIQEIHLKEQLKSINEMEEDIHVSEQEENTYPIF